ncbi:GDP-D-glucose phosphorylase 1 [Tanacetum coccineum]
MVKKDDEESKKSKSEVDEESEQVSPIEYGHVLLIPRILERLLERIGHKTLFLAIYMAHEAPSPYFGLGCNSFGTFATVNHLHFQVDIVQFCQTQTLATASLRLESTTIRLSISECNAKRPVS